MKEVLRREFSAFDVLAGSTSAFRRTGTKDSISGLEITFPNCFKLLLADVRTCAWESVRTPVRRGITIGKESESGVGEQYAIMPRSSMDPFFVRHCFSSSPDNRDGNISLTPYPDMLPMITRAAS